MAEPITPEPAPPVSRITLIGVGLFVVALMALLLAFPASQPKVAPEDMDMAAIFSRNCAICHGPTGQGKGRFPKIAGTTKTEEEILRQLENGKGDMPKFEATREQREAMARYVKELKK